MCAVRCESKYSSGFRYTIIGAPVGLSPCVHIHYAGNCRSTASSRYSSVTSPPIEPIETTMKEINEKSKKKKQQHAVQSDDHRFCTCGDAPALIIAPLYRHHRHSPNCLSHLSRINTLANNINRAEQPRSQYETKTIH